MMLNGIELLPDVLPALNFGIPFLADSVGAPNVQSIGGLADWISGSVEGIWGRMQTGTLLILSACVAIALIRAWLSSSLQQDTVGFVSKGVSTILAGCIMMMCITNMPTLNRYFWSGAGVVMHTMSPTGQGSAVGGGVGGMFDTLWSQFGTTFVELWRFAGVSRNDRGGQQKLDSLKSKIEAGEAEKVGSRWIFGKEHIPYYHANGLDPEKFCRNTDTGNITNTTFGACAWGEENVYVYKSPEEIENDVGELSWVADSILAVAVLIVTMALLLLFALFMMFKLVSALFQFIAGVLLLPVAMAFYPLIEDWARAAVTTILGGMIQLGMVSFVMGITASITQQMTLHYAGTDTSLFGNEIGFGSKWMFSLAIMGFCLMLLIGGGLPFQPEHEFLVP